MNFCVSHYPTIPVASWMAQWLKKKKKILLSMQEMWVQPLGREDSPGEGNGNPLSILASEISWTEKPGRL